MHIGEEERGRWKDRPGPAINDMPNIVHGPRGESCPWDKMNRHVSELEQETREALNVPSVGFRHINSNLICTRTKHTVARGMYCVILFIYLCVSHTHR